MQFERLSGIFIPPQRRMRVRDLIPFRSTSLSGVDFVRRDTFTNAASPVAETVSKGESAITYTIDSANVRTIAHWVPAARQVLEDVAGLQAAIDFDLLAGLADVEDYELLRGSGAGQHLKGIITAATTAYAGTYTVASDTYIDTVNHAIAELEDENYEPDGLVIHPSDWRKMQLIKEAIAAANTGAYILGGPAASPRKLLWDLPVVGTPAMIKGKFLVGQFVGSVMGFDRMKAVIDVSTEHESYFIKNMVAVRAELRLAVAVTKPGAFRYGSF
jgi:HK97 family phage major capsid protein